IWRRLLKHCVARADSRAACTAGNNNAASRPMIPITIISSIIVKPDLEPTGAHRFIGIAPADSRSPRIGDSIRSEAMGAGVRQPTAWILPSEPEPCRLLEQFVSSREEASLPICRAALGARQLCEMDVS